MDRVTNSTLDPDTDVRRLNDLQIFISVAGSLLIIWIILFNLLLIISILVNKKIRGEVFYLLVCNAALTFLLIGALVIPFSLSFHLHGHWPYSRCVCSAYIFMEVLFYVSVVIGLLMASLERLLYTLSATLFKNQKVFFAVGLLSIPWIIGILVVLPSALQNDKFDTYMGSCSYMFGSEFVYPVYIITYFIPALCILVLDAFSVILHFIRRRQPNLISKEMRLDQSNAIFSIIALTVVDLVFLSLTFFFHVILIMGAVCSDDADCVSFVPAAIMNVAWALCYIALGLAQFGWLIDPQLRQSILDLICCRLCKRKKEAVHERFGTPEAHYELTTATNVDDNDKRVKHFIDDSIASSEEEVSETLEQPNHILNTSEQNNETGGN